MRITTIVRTLNEERNIERFLNRYGKISDEIVISDGGSTDKTYKLAWKWSREHGHEPRIWWQDCKDLQIKAGEGMYTHEPKHINKAFALARESNPDWMIYDDCDCWPNKALMESARQWFEYANKEGYNQIYVYRLYVYKNKWYFPDMNKPGQSIWAWKPGLNITCDESGDPREQNMRVPEGKVLYLGHPYCLLHNFAQSDRHISDKMRFYEGVKGQPQLHPKDGCGRLEVLPEAFK